MQQRTLGYEESIAFGATAAVPARTAVPLSTQDTIAAASVDQTLAAPSEAALSAVHPPPSAWRSTVLPRVDADGASLELVVEHKTRYEPMKLLGKGGMGEVVLVKDQDIARTVALKRLLPELTDPALLRRFVDEIRTVGRLEHPNIVPIHDVGVDELGRYFFVMKYVEGETLEDVIEKLKSGDPAYQRKYTFERRIELFLGILHALEFAHDAGFVHRDIKPANVMVGRYGEIVLMDWGIAKPMAAKSDAASGADASVGADGKSERDRMFATRIGSLIGTPAYMSPEQARGDNDKIDMRSDLYSAAVMFHELMSLKHVLHHHETMTDLLGAVQTEEYGFMKLLGIYGEAQGRPPGEIIHICAKGLQKDPAMRYQSAREMIDLLEDVLAGNVRIQCHVTATKRMTRRLGQLVDRSPHAMIFGFLSLAAMAGFGAFELVRMAVH